MNVQRLITYLDDNQVIEVGYKIFENSVPSDNQFNQLSTKSITS